MSVEDIIGAIQRETTAEVEAIAREAQATAEKIVGDGSARAVAIEAAAVDARREEIEQAADRIRNRARLEADRTMRAARDDVVHGLLDATAAKLAAIRTSDGYPSVLARLLDEAQSALPTAAVLHVDARDERAAEIAAGDAGLEVVADLDTDGGMVLSSRDGRTVDNTIERRLARADPYLRQIVREMVPELGSPPS